MLIEHGVRGDITPEIINQLLSQPSLEEAIKEMDPFLLAQLLLLLLINENLRFRFALKLKEEIITREIEAAFKKGWQEMIDAAKSE